MTSWIRGVSKTWAGVDSNIDGYVGPLFGVCSQRCSVSFRRLPRDGWLDEDDDECLDFDLLTVAIDLDR